MNCLVLIFSRNRALQLDATLRSFLLHCQDAEATKVRVLYTTTDPLHASQYDELNAKYNRHPFIRFVCEQDFRSDVLAMLARIDHVVFLVDDTIFVREFSIQKSLDLLSRHSDALAYSFRLGLNTTFSYMSDSAQDLPSFTQIDSEVLKYRWSEAQHDFGYPLELSSSMYRVANIHQVITQLSFSNPNTLEGQLAEQTVIFSRSHPYLLCYQHSVAFSNPINLVQTAWENRAGRNPKYTSQSLAGQFAQGYRINVDFYANFSPRAVHQEVELKFELQGTKSSEDHDSFHKETPIVSVVIPCYQQAELLPEAVSSVILQTYDDYEIIIVNDGSTDNAADVGLSLSQKFPDKKIRVISQANQGLAEARNVGIRNSVGRYILPLDADDLIAPTMLERMVHILETRSDIGIAYPDTVTFGEVSEYRQARDWDFPTLCTTNILSYCALYRKEVWEVVGGYNANMKPTYEDWDFWIGCGEKGIQGLRIPEPLFIYRVRSNTLASVGLKYDKELKARIILNHSNLYTDEVVKTARSILANWKSGSFLNAEETKSADMSLDGRNKMEHSIVALERPLVSVIVPTKDRPNMLVNALRSILRQTYRNFEVIVINDGGCDIENIISCLDPEKRIIYVRLPKSRERSFCRNLGIELARGKYISYLDDDDQFYPHHVETLVEFLEKTGNDVAYTDALRVHQCEENGEYVTKASDCPYSQDFDNHLIYVGNFVPNLCLMHAKSCIERVGGFESSLEPHEDWDLLIRLSQKYSIHHLKIVTAEFSWRTDGTTSTSARQQDFLRTRELIYKKYQHVTQDNPNVRKVQQQVLGNIEKTKRGEFECSIIIPVWNRCDLTMQCLKALAETTSGVLYEVIVIDNSSTDETEKFLAALEGDIRVIRNDENRGFAKACNQGARIARGKYIVFLNNDTIPKSGWLDALVEEVQAHSEVAVVGSKLLYPDDTIQHAGVVFSRFFQTPYHIFNGAVENLPAVNVRRELQAVTAACMLVQKETFEEVGGFDEGFENGFEDVDFCLKVRQLEKKVVYQPKSCLYHLESQTSGRKRQDKKNGKRLLARWERQWLVDEDIIADEGGCIVQCYLLEGRTRFRLVPKQNSPDSRVWQYVVKLQQLLLGQKCQPLVNLPEHQKIRDLLVNVESWPADLGILEWVGRVCETLGLEAEAARFWEKLLSIGDHPDARVGLARASLKKGNLQEAQKHLDILKNEFSPREAGWTLQGVLYMQTQEFLLAKNAFEMALKCDQSHERALIGLGMACMGLGEHEEAWTQFNQVLSQDPDNLEAIRCLIQVGTVLEKWERLFRQLDHFVERNPATSEIRFALAGVAVRGGHIEKAREQLSWFQLFKPDYEGLEDLSNALNNVQVLEPTMSVQ